MSAATVSIAGAKSTITVDLGEGDTVLDVLQGALLKLGLPKETVAKLSAVRNGDDAQMHDRVEPGDVVTGAGKVANG